VVASPVARNWLLGSPVDDVGILATDH